MAESIMETLSGPRGASLRAQAKRICGTQASGRLLGRIHCVLLVNEGRSIAEVARWFGVHRRTLERWMAEYRRNGEAGLQDETRTGRPPRLSADQRAALVTELAGPPQQLGYSSDAWSGRLLRHHLAGRYDVRFSLRQCQRLLHRLRDSEDVTEVDTAVRRPSVHADRTPAPGAGSEASRSF